MDTKSFSVLPFTLKQMFDGFEFATDQDKLLETRLHGLYMLKIQVNSTT